jgi:arsenate reductase
MIRVLFTCFHDVSWSQMAAAWFNRFADPRKALGVSAEVEPVGGVLPVVLETLREEGIDSPKVEPQRLTLDLARRAAYLVTLGSGETGPSYPGARTIDWPSLDPAGQGIKALGAIRDELADRVRSFVTEHRWD